MVRQEEIGKIYTVNKNGLTFVATISQDPSLYKFYTDLGLDVFEKSKRDILKSLLDNYGIDYKENSSEKVLQKKLDDYLAESHD